MTGAFTGSGHGGENCRRPSNYHGKSAHDHQKIAQKFGIPKEMCQSHNSTGSEYEKIVCTVPTQESDKRSEIHAQDVSGESSVNLAQQG